MTALQEAVQKFIEATKLDRIEFEDWPRDSQTAFEALRTALEQHEADKPFQPDWTNYRQGVEDGKAEALAQQAATKNCPQPEICGSKECEFCRDTAAPAPQPAQDALQDIAAYIGVGGYNGATTEQLSERIRVEFDRLAALQSTQPKQEPLTDKRISWLWSESHNDTTDRMAFQVFARAIEAAHGINGMVEAATRPAIDVASKQGCQHE